MLVEYYFPHALSPSRLDRYLAGGWFRSGPSLFRAQVLCLNGDAHSVVNIRTQLENFTFSKSLRKLYNKNSRKFRFEMGIARTNEACERLYQLQKHRFQGFIFDTLEEFLFAGDSEELFDTREIRVYDGDKLIAVSYFDLGNKSIASLLGLYDPEYESHSLGIYTMILEVYFGISNEMKYYYPGYILEDYPGFDYKLRIGNIQYYNWHGRWKPYHKLANEQFILPEIHSRTLQIEQFLREHKLLYKKFLYPFFSVGYLSLLEEEFVKSVIFLQLDVRSIFDQDLQLIIEYIPDEGKYYLTWARVNSDYTDFVKAEFSDGLFGGEVFRQGLLVREQILYQDKNPRRLVERAIKSLPSQPGLLVF
ncbi:MAG: hypothetical protein AAFY71_01290 [Bacteroidota bacterium]